MICLYFSTLFSYALSANEDSAANCMSIFEHRYETCRSIEGALYTSGGLSTAEKSNCSLFAPYYLPVGWYDYKTPLVTQYTFAELELSLNPDGTLSTRDPKPPAPASQKTTEGKHDDFDKYCPMYGPKSNLSSCCLHRSRFTSNSDITAVFFQLKSLNRQYQFMIYPKCYELLRYMPCALCNPKIHMPNFTIYNAGMRNIKSFPKLHPVYAYRLCDNYAEKIWHNCRRAYFNGDEKKLIVPKNMGIQQFKELMRVPDPKSEFANKCLDINDINPFYKD